MLTILRNDLFPLLIKKKNEVFSIIILKYKLENRTHCLLCRLIILLCFNFELVTLKIRLSDTYLGFPYFVI